MTHVTFEEAAKCMALQQPSAEAEDLPALKTHSPCSCPECSAKIVRLRMLVEITAEDHSVAPPAEILQQALACFRLRSGAHD